MTDRDGARDRFSRGTARFLPPPPSTGCLPTLVVYLTPGRNDTRGPHVGSPNTRPGQSRHRCCMGFPSGRPRAACTSEMGRGSPSHRLASMTDAHGGRDVWPSHVLIGPASPGLLLAYLQPRPRAVEHHTHRANRNAGHLFWLEIPGTASHPCSKGPVPSGEPPLGIRIRS